MNFFFSPREFAIVFDLFQEQNKQMARSATHSARTIWQGVYLDHVWVLLISIEQKLSCICPEEIMFPGFNRMM